MLARTIKALSTRRRGRDEGGFTLVEVLIAIVIAMIGLLGTVAVQSTILSATQNASDAAIAGRLASQTVEELGARTAFSPLQDRLAAIANGTWSVTTYVDANGVTSATLTPQFRFSRQFRVTNTGTAQPYNISVQVGYALDSGLPKTMQVDVERRKAW
jgi:Tfp pilus assembly protein PilV